MEAIEEPKRASTSGDMCAHRLCAMYTSRTGSISKLVYNTAACFPHAPRPGNVGEGVFWSGVGL